MPTAIKIAFVQLVILAGGLVAVELALRYLAPLPVHGGIFLDANGEGVRVAKNDVLLVPNLKVTHVGSEFSAEINTDELGYRQAVNESRRPKYLFLGDSFTFGHGVADGQIFPNLFCAKRGVSCLNLGRSGTDTFDQVRILEHAIDRFGVRPETVVVVMLGACWIDSSGNDLGGNLANHAARAASGPTTAALPGDNTSSPVSRSQERPASAFPIPRAANGIVKTLQGWIDDFEITRRTMLIATGRLKSSLYACSEPAKIAAALAATKIALDELARLAFRNHFKVEIYLIHPYQELAGAYRQTEGHLRPLMPRAFQFVGTGDRFRKEHYFSYDGHFNAAGHANMAAILMSRH